jgi:hypothetical protein
MPTPPKKLRKLYHNEKYPEIVLRFEDGHEIKIAKGATKGFDAWAGERIKILAIWDHTSGERERSIRCSPSSSPTRVSRRRTKPSG